jgi:PhnB protein
MSAACPDHPSSHPPQAPGVEEPLAAGIGNRYDDERTFVRKTNFEEVPMADVKAIPDGYPRVTPSLIIDGAAAAIDFYTGVFGAGVRMRMEGPDGRIGHAELQLGDSVLMLADEMPDMGILGPRSVGGTPVTISVYVEDVDATFERALKAGATEKRPVENQFYGDRSGQFEDPFGHRWNVGSHIEDVPEDEMMRRAEQAMSQG